MNPPTQSAFAPNAAHSSAAAEETLRLIARLPAPQGLEDRVKAGLHTASSGGRVLHWPVVLRPGQGWVHSTMMRSAAAAAIVFVVAGGGWSIYTRMQPAQTPSAVVLPPRLSAPGSFSSAGAMRTPQTLNGPVLTHKVTATPRQPHTAAKAPAHARQKPLHNGKPARAK
ncbi:MAG TPA: hypothetical protein VMV39_00715 [Terracidiphilus sp.]|nr:hypothetical protein [Terracidiphilus sp.]